MLMLIDKMCVCVVLFLGEKLDYKACESLEEILKRVQFKVIDLEQTNLDEDVRISHLNPSLTSRLLVLCSHMPFPLFFHPLYCSSILPSV